jgi:hypothetical protein
LGKFQPIELVKGMENSRTVGNNFKDQVYFYSGLLKEQYQNLPQSQQNSLKLVVAAGGAGTSFFFLFLKQFQLDSLYGNISKKKVKKKRKIEKIASMESF